jgi:esterase/lipase superfamily enzyme
LAAAVMLTVSAYASPWGASSNNDRETSVYSAAAFRREMGYKEPERVQEKSWWQKTADSWESSWQANHQRVSAIEYSIVLPAKLDYISARIVHERSRDFGLGLQWHGEFSVRNEYVEVGNVKDVKFSSIRPAAKSLSYDFVLDTDNDLTTLRNSKSLDLFVHGFNTNAQDARTQFSRFERSLYDATGYESASAVISWSSDLGKKSSDKLVRFNQAVQSSRWSAQGIANVVDFARSANAGMAINAVAYSLGARLVLNAAEQGVKFDNVVMLLPAIDYDELSKGQRFDDALKNIKHLTIVYSKNQGMVFGVYLQERFEKAAGQDGLALRSSHANLLVVNATKKQDNRWQMEISNHGDIYEKQTMRFVREMLEQKERAQ